MNLELVSQKIQNGSYVNAHQYAEDIRFVTCQHERYVCVGFRYIACVQYVYVWCGVATVSRID